MTYTYNAVVVSVHDGDTVTLTLDLGFSIQVTYPCRVWGINAPELSTDAGKTARDYAQQLLPPGAAVTVFSHGWDKYAPRFDGSITMPNGADFAAEMLMSGNAVPYPTR